MASKYVDQLAQSLIVHATRLEAHLVSNGFDQNEMTNPDLHSRERWFRQMKTAS